MANLKMRIIGCKPLAVESRSILKIERCKPFLLLSLGSLVYGDVLEAYTELFKKIEAYTGIKHEIKGVLRKSSFKGVIK